MAEKKDTEIKKKHKEFNERIKSILDDVRGESVITDLSPGIQQLRQSAELLKQG